MARRKRKQRPTEQGGHGQGLDFGFRPRVLLASGSAIEFNRFLIEANVFGLAYGADRYPGYPPPLACLSFVAEREELLAKAFACFDEWGAQNDGDTVDMTIILKNTGEYLMAVSPEFDRFAHRMIRDDVLVEPILSGLTWIKRLDTTNPILRDWMEALKSRIFPVQVRAAVATLEGRTPRMDTVRDVAGVQPFIKFNLKIQSEDDDPESYLLKIANEEELPSSYPPKHSAKSIANARRKLMRAIFPVSRERIRRARLVEACRAQLSALPVAASQIEQAAMNVALSREWGAAGDHYEGIADLDNQWPDKLKRRVDDVQSADPFATMPPDTVTKQLAHDVAYALRRHGAQVEQRLATNQKLFERLGYAGDI